MRFPLDKVYRAFPELDPFTDEQCRRFVQRVRVTGSYRPALLSAVILTAAGALGAVIVLRAVFGDPLHELLWKRMHVERRTAETLIMSLSRITCACLCLMT